MPIPPWLSPVLGALARWGLTALGALLVERGFLTDEQSAAFVDGGVDWLLGVLALAVALAWSIWRKYQQHHALALVGGPDVPPEQGRILRSALAHVEALAKAAPAKDATDVRVVAFVVHDATGTELGAGAFIGEKVALTAAMRDSMRDGKLRPDQVVASVVLR